MHRYAIKGMVCHRCDLAVAELAEGAGGEVAETGRGFATFTRRLDAPAEAKFSRALGDIGFSILRTEAEELSEAMELALRGLLPDHLDVSNAGDLRDALCEWAVSDERLRAVSYEYASTLFRQHTGVTPLARYQTLRMAWAGERLREGRLQASEVGYALGYQHLSGFSRAFKRAMGASPVEWMQA